VLPFCLAAFPASVPFPSSRDGRFYGIFPITGLLAGQLLAKVTLSIVLVPVLIQACVAFGKWLDRPAEA